MKFLSLVTIFLQSSSWIWSAVSAHEDDHPHTHDDDDDDDTHSHYEWINLDVKMPFPVSDMSATLVNDAELGIRNKVYFVGGCDSLLGNELNQDDGFFYCKSITDRMSVFDANTRTFENGPSAPIPRYRHAAAYDGNGYIWLVGGRDIETNLISEVNVFDVAKNEWTDFRDTLPEELSLSDNAAWGQNGLVFVTGGYSANYTALTTTFYIDPATSLTTGKLAFTQRQGLNEGRGDVHVATVTNDLGQTYAYITGGFTHKDMWCEPHATTERYDFGSDQWELQANLTYARADKALVSLGSRIYALSGEALTECAEDINHKTTPINEVEMLETANGDDAVWETVDDLPSDRFRFPAVGITDQSTIFAFGGQKYYDIGCECFATSDVVTVYQEDSDHDHDHGDDNNEDKLTKGGKAGIAIGTLAGSFLLLYCFYAVQNRSGIEAHSGQAGDPALEAPHDPTELKHDVE